MTQEEKQLLIKDLCVRFPYGVICRMSAKDADVSITEKLDIGGIEHFIYGTMNVEPYLRPMSSMTEKEWEEYERTFDSVYDVDDYGEYDDSWHEEFSIHSLDWLNAHHFDYRGLIEKGLALEAPEGMYI